MTEGLAEGWVAAGKSMWQENERELECTAVL